MDFLKITTILHLGTSLLVGFEDITVKLSRKFFLLAVFIYSIQSFKLIGHLPFCFISVVVIVATSPYN